MTQPPCVQPLGDEPYTCGWSSLPVATPPGSRSGVYVAVLTSAAHFQTIVPFVVRDERPATFAYLSPVNTYEAYNAYPDGAGGRSLYVPDGKAAVKVSFDRPFSRQALLQFLQYEPPAIAFLEREGYDVNYLTDPDLDADPGVASRYRALIVAGHAEYWTRAMLDGVTAARDSGHNLAFMGANVAHWQVRYEHGGDGAPRRTLVGYKDAKPDPIADTHPELRTDRRWRFLGRPEQTLVGGQYVPGSYETAGAQPLQIASAVGWPFEGTGLVSGQVLPGEYLGYEIDAYDSSAPLPTGAVTVLASSPFHGASGLSVTQRSTLYAAPSGALVFGAGTLAWSWALTPGYGEIATSTATNESPAIERLTQNIFDRMAGPDAPARP